MMEGIEGIQKNIYALVDEQFEYAAMIQNIWMRDVAKRELLRSNRALNESEKTHYELRLEFSRYSFTIRWFRVKWVIAGGKRKRFAVDVPQPKTSSGYKAKDFKLASEWELGVILKAEEELQPIRNKLKKLSYMHKSLNEYAKLEDSAFKYTPISERVTIPNRSISDIKKTLQ